MAQSLFQELPLLKLFLQRGCNPNLLASAEGPGEFSLVAAGRLQMCAKNG